MKRLRRIILGGLTALLWNPDIPELSHLSWKERWRVWVRCTRKAGRHWKAQVAFIVPIVCSFLLLLLALTIMNCTRLPSWVWGGVLAVSAGVAVVGGSVHRRMVFRMALPYIRAELPNLCASCGYDLRATPQRCPECGTLATAKAGE